MSRNVNIVKDVNNNNIVIINDIRFKGKRSVKYTYSLRGTAAKAKANAAQGIPEMLEIALDKKFEHNREAKHQWNARNGWYRYDSRFALPVFLENGEVERYNIFHASMLIRCANDGRLYLYDILEIKKETGNPLES